MTARARMWRGAGGLCLLLACDGGSAGPVIRGSGGDGSTGQAGEGGARAAGISGAGAPATAGSANTNVSAPGFDALAEPDEEAFDRDDDAERGALGGSGGGAGSGGRAFGGSDSGGGGRAGNGGSGTDTDDDDDRPSARGQRRYALMPNDAIWHALDDCLGAPICHVMRND
jgi:hypothetical protein